MRTKYIKDNSKYFKWLNRNKDKYKIINVALTKTNSIKIKYKLLTQ